jgi:hypothetical protein
MTKRMRNMVAETQTRKQKPGRPRATPEYLERVVADLYGPACGYRKIARVLRGDYHLKVHWTTVKRALVRHSKVQLQ